MPRAVRGVEYWLGGRGGVGGWLQKRMCGRCQIRSRCGGGEVGVAVVFQMELVGDEMVSVGYRQCL